MKASLSGKQSYCSRHKFTLFQLYQSSGTPKITNLRINHEKKGSIKTSNKWSLLWK